MIIPDNKFFELGLVRLTINTIPSIVMILIVGLWAGRKVFQSKDWISLIFLPLGMSLFSYWFAMKIGLTTTEDGHRKLDGFLVILSPLILIFVRLVVLGIKLILGSKKDFFPFKSSTFCFASLISLLITDVAASLELINSTERTVPGGEGILDALCLGLAGVCLIWILLDCVEDKECVLKRN